MLHLAFDATPPDHRPSSKLFHHSSGPGSFGVGLGHGHHADPSPASLPESACEPDVLRERLNDLNLSSSATRGNESAGPRLACDRLSDVTLASRKANEAASRRFQAAAWIHKMVGPLPDLPLEPSEEELRHCLRNGLVLCSLINKIHPGAVSKVVENPAPSSPPPQGAALSAYQYFENVRNFLQAVEELNLPSFQASDLDNGGSLQTGSCSTKIVDCILSLKAYQEWQRHGGTRLWKATSGGPFKSPHPLIKHLNKIGSGRYSEHLYHSSRHCQVRDSSRKRFPFEEINSPFSGQRVGHSRRQSNDELFDEMDFSSLWAHHVSQRFNDVVRSSVKASQEDISIDQMSDTPRSSFESVSSESLSKLIMLALYDKQIEEVPLIVEVMLRKVIEEYERRLISHEEQFKRNHGAMKEDGTEAGILNLQIELDAALKINQRHAHVLESQNEELNTLKRMLEATRNHFQDAQCEWRKEMELLDAKLHGLAQAAAEYHKVAAENRELYNQVQDLKGNIRVYCRVRPFLPGETNNQSTVDFVGEKGSIMIVNPNKQGKDQRKSFTFNKVFGPSAAQAEVFLDTQPLIRSVLDGFNVCIFAYGQTGSGKTYTMTGPNNPSPDDLGVNFRALNDLFEISRNRKEYMAYEVGVQMMEIYNEQVRDLLCSDGSNKRLEIRNNSQQNGLNVPDATMLPVHCTKDVLDFMALGHKNRAVGSTALNERSSRSHSVLAVHVKAKDLGSGAILRGCLHLVDLAGSERVDKSEVTGDRLKEAQHINKSLSALGDVIAALAQKNAHVPYRNSKLTQLLQDSLGGQAKTLMFVHVSPDEESYAETISTLKFAERVATVELGAAQSNKESGEVRDLKDQIAFLKDALMKKDAELEKNQKELKLKQIDNLQEKGKLKSVVSPVVQHQQRRVSVDVVQQAQGKRRQPLEEVRNSEVRPSPLNVGIVQRYAATDLHAVALDSHSPSVFGNEHPEAIEGSCKRRAVKLHRQSNTYSEEELVSSPAGNNEGRSTSKNKIRREGSIEPTSLSTPQETAPDMFLEKSTPQCMTMVFNTSKKCSEDRSLRGTFLKPCSITGARDLSSMELSAQSGVDFEDASKSSDDMVTWTKLQLDTVPAVLETKGNKRNADKRLPLVKQSCALPKTDANNVPATVQKRSRRLSNTGSEAKKAVATRATGSTGTTTTTTTTTTLEAKFIAVSSEGGTVECYAKATLPRQSSTTTTTASLPISVQKASKRWM